MSGIHMASVRTDEDILAEIDHLIAHYPPLVHDRRTIRVEVNAGCVTVRGNLMSPNTAEYLLNRIGQMDGVQMVEAAELFDDQSLRLEIAHLLPAGVMIASIRQGFVVLTGTLPPHTDLNALIHTVAAVPGVRQVINGFGG